MNAQKSLLLTIVKGSRPCKKDVGRQGQSCKYLRPPSATGLPCPKPQPSGGPAQAGAQALPPPVPRAGTKVTSDKRQPGAEYLGESCEVSL